MNNWFNHINDSNLHLDAGLPAGLNAPLTLGVYKRLRCDYALALLT
jgi:hypothetical protein